MSNKLMIVLQRKNMACHHLVPNPIGIHYKGQTDKVVKYFYMYWVPG